MSIISLKCKNCGSFMTVNFDSKTVLCKHCGSTFLLSELLDSKDVDIAKKLNPNMLTEKMDAGSEIKKGDARVYAFDFKTAETHYKRAIELDETNYKAYLGLVRAKTKNLTFLPDEDDYKEYAKLAVKFVSKEDSIYLKNELSKLDLLKKEKKRKEEAEVQKQKRQAERQQRKTHLSNVILCLIMITVIVSASICIPLLFKKTPQTPQTQAKKITISTADELISLSASSEALSANITLACDINLNNQTLPAIGTKNSPFNGTFDGNGFAIKNAQLKFDSESEETNVGLFCYTKNATIKNLTLSSITALENRNNQIFNDYFIGLVCAQAENTTISNVNIDSFSSIDVTVERYGEFAIGGLVGKATNLTITNSNSDAEISVNAQNIELGFGKQNPLSNYFGGLVGKATNITISGSSSNSNVEAEIIANSDVYVSNNLSGLVGLTDGTSSNIENSYFAGSISSNKNDQISNSFALLSNYDANTTINFQKCSALNQNNFTENSTSLSISKLKNYERTQMFETKDEILNYISQN